MDYVKGFSFMLDDDNAKWKPYYTIWKQKNNKTGIGVYSVSKYFLDETNEMLSKIFENDPSIISLDAVSSKSINLSKEIFSDWDLIYNTDLLTNGESCCIAIPGYLYKSSAQSCFSVVNNIIKTQVILTDSITISDYAQLVEDLLVLRFGKKPQDFTGSQIEYFIPCQELVISNSIKKSYNNLKNTIEEPKAPELKSPDLSEYSIQSSVKYFILHSSGGVSSKKTIEGWDAEGKGHAYILQNGEIVKKKNFNELAWATKTEKKTNSYYQAAARGACIHIELVYTDSGNPNDEQYGMLAKIYYNIYKKNNRKLIIVPHREFDRGIPDGHDDPKNFDFNKFYKILLDEYKLSITPGIEGITQERYSKPNQSDNVYHFPPILSGRIERKQ